MDYGGRGGVAFFIATPHAPGVNSKNIIYGYQITSKHDIRLPKT